MLPVSGTIRLADCWQTWNPNADPVEDVKSPWVAPDTGAGFGSELASFNYAVIERATITVQPVGGVGVLGGEFTLGVTATGGNLQYGWYKDGVRVFAEAGSEWVRATLAANDGGDYKVKVGNRSTETDHVEESDEVNLNVIGITETPASGNFATVDTVTAQYCGTPGTVEFALVVDGVVGTYQDSPALEIGDNFGVPLKVRVRHKTETAKWHESGEFTATQIYKWKCTGGTDGFVTLNQIFANNANVDYSQPGLSITDVRSLGTATAVGQAVTHNGIVNDGGVGTHSNTYTSV